MHHNYPNGFRSPPTLISDRLAKFVWSQAAKNSSWWRSWWPCLSFKELTWQLNALLHCDPPF